jgi:hypothetical protein
VRLAAFLLRYLRRHVAWLALAGVAGIAYAATTVSLIGLIEPVFSEVLLADSSAVAAFAPAAGDAEAGVDAASAEEPQGGLVGFFQSINLRDYLAARYQHL